MSDELLVRTEAARFVAGLVTRGDRCVLAAPIVRQFVGTGGDDADIERGRARLRSCATRSMIQRSSCAALPLFPNASRINWRCCPVILADEGNPFFRSSE